MTASLAFSSFFSSSYPEPNEKMLVANPIPVEMGFLNPIKIANEKKNLNLLHFGKFQIEPVLTDRLEILNVPRTLYHLGQNKASAFFRQLIIFVHRIYTFCHQ